MSDPFKVYGSVQDHGSYVGVVDLSYGRDRIRPVEFERAPGGEGSSHAIDPDNPDIVYSAGFYGTIMRTEMSDNWYASSEVILPATFPDEPRLRGQWIAPFIL